jgi:hypothetical protein
MWVRRLTDTPFYDELAAVHQTNWYLSLLSQELMPSRSDTFDVCEEDYEQIPTILANATDAVMRTFANKDFLVRARKNFKNDADFDQYVIGFRDAIEAIRHLPPPRKHD